MNIYARQGDLVIEKVKKVTGELRKATNFVLAGTDSPHTLRGTVQLRREGLVTFVRVPKATEIAHAGRHEPVKLAKGDYEIRPLRERGAGMDRAVED